MAKGAEFVLVRIFLLFMVGSLSIGIETEGGRRAVAQSELDGTARRDMLGQEEALATTERPDEPTCHKGVPAEAAPAETTVPREDLTWISDYATAVRAAKQRRSMLVIWFQDAAQAAKNERFQQEVLRNPEVREQLENFVLAQIPVTTSQPLPVRASSSDEERPEDVTSRDSDGGDEAYVALTMPVTSSATPSPTSKTPPRRLLDHPAFSELGGEPGLAVLDLTDETSPHFHHVVSVFPLQSRTLSIEQMVALLTLPSGSLTQRTLIWAVWTHPEKPQSADGQPHEALEQEAESHSHHQAVIRVQGHHRWGSRFQRLMGRLPSGLVAQEVCAESWPGQRLIDAAEECVRSWRHSSGHWDAVRRRHPVFGYDMKRGANGIWYATGVFGRRQ